MVASRSNHVATVEALLAAPGIDVNCKDDKGKTLLTLVFIDLKERSESFVKFLFKKGADRWESSSKLTS